MNFVRNFILFPLFAQVFFHFSYADQCVPKHSYVSFPDDFSESVQYARIHPNGRYILFTMHGSTYLGIIRNGKLEIRETPMMGEAFPAPGNWDIIASPRHEFMAEGYSYNYDTGTTRLKKEGSPNYIDMRSGDLVTASGDIVQRSAYKLDGETLTDSKGNVIYQKEMKYFRFSDILSQGMNAQPMHTDKVINDWYQSLSSSVQGHTTSVGVLDQQARYRETQFQFSGDQTIEKVSPGPVQRACPGGIQGEHTYSTEAEKRRLEVQKDRVIKKYRRLSSKIYEMSEGFGCNYLTFIYEDPNVVILSANKEVIYAPADFSPDTELNRAFDYGYYQSQIEQGPYYNVNEGAEQITFRYNVKIFYQGPDLIPSKFNCLNLNKEQKAKVISDYLKLNKEAEALAVEYRDINEALGLVATRGMTLYQPMMSPDGKEFSSTQGSTIIYNLSTTGKCTVAESIDFQTSKIIFGPRKTGQKGQVAFGDDEGRALLLDKDKDRLVHLNEEGSEFNGTSSYPGFLSDGRILFIAKKDGKPVVVIVDPNQVDSALGECVKLSSQPDLMEESAVQ